MKRILCLRIENQEDHGHSGRGTGFQPVIENLAAQPIDALQTVAARCKQFTPLVGIDPDVFPQSALLDITNVVHLFGGETALVQRILGELRAEGWQLRAAVAGTPGAAWALAGYGRQEEGGERKAEGGRPGHSGYPLAGRGSANDGQSAGDGHPTILSQATGLNGAARFLPTAAPCPRPTAISSLPLKALRLPEPIVASLHSLGIWQIEQLEALPRRELSSRFGPELLDCLDRVTGRLPEPLPAWDPPPQFEVRWSAEFPITRRETISTALEQLVRRLTAMLAQAGRGAMRLDCLLKCSVGEPRHVAVGLFRPSAWANHLVQLLQVQFDSLRLPGPVDSIRLTAASTAPLELRQHELFSEGRTRIQPHHLSGLIDRLSNRLGRTCVMRVRLIPDAQPELACHYTPLVLGNKGVGSILCEAPRKPVRQNRPDPFISPTPLSQPRPLRLLTQPVRLPGGIDGPFYFAGRQHRIVRRLGPERIETGWWRGRTVARDYYRIETTTGHCYWVFRRLPAGPWFLHGMFD